MRFTTPITQKYIDYAPECGLYHRINGHFYSEDDGAEYMLTFAMRIESSIVNSKQIQILY